MADNDPEAGPVVIICHVCGSQLKADWDLPSTMEQEENTRRSYERDPLTATIDFEAVWRDECLEALKGVRVELAGLRQTVALAALVALSDDQIARAYPLDPPTLMRDRWLTKLGRMA